MNKPCLSVEDHPLIRIVVLHPVVLGFPKIYPHNQQQFILNSSRDFKSFLDTLLL